MLDAGLKEKMEILFRTEDQIADLVNKKKEQEALIIKSLAEKGMFHCLTLNRNRIMRDISR